MSGKAPTAQARYFIIRLDYFYGKNLIIQSKTKVSSDSVDMLTSTNNYSMAHNIALNIAKNLPLVSFNQIGIFYLIIAGKLQEEFDKED
jgi:hypothetical protein